MECKKFFLIILLNLLMPIGRAGNCLSSTYTAAQESIIAFERAYLHCEHKAHLSALILALYVNDKEWALRLINAIKAEGDITISSRDILGYTPLHYAAAFNRTAIAELLLAEGANINAQDNNEQTPLHCATYHCNEDMVRLLIVRGAHVNAQDNKRRTPLHLTQMWRTRIDQGYENNVTTVLISNGGDINAQDKVGNTLLHRVVKIDNHIMLSRLLDLEGENINFNLKNEDGKTAIDLARQQLESYQNDEDSSDEEDKEWRVAQQERRKNMAKSCKAQIQLIEQAMLKQRYVKKLKLLKAKKEQQQSNFLKEQKNNSFTDVLIFGT